MDTQSRKRLIQASLGVIPLDLLIRDVQVVNVYTGRIEPGAIGILDGRIVTPAASDQPAREIVEGRGRFAAPGLIDTHVHLDSTLLVPESLAEVVVPSGTTCMLADPMESANVAGLAGLEALLHSRDRLPYHILIEVSSRVPTAPGLETTGGELGLKEVEQVLGWPDCVSLGELDPSKVLGLGDEYLAKVEAALRLGKIANGHAAGLDDRKLLAYACGGLADDHECVDDRDALARLSLGLSVLVREGSSERNLDLILRGVLRGEMDTRHLMFCTDDKHPDDIRKEGHINFMVNRAIELGIPPLTALQMATLNAAEHFRIDSQYGSLAPGRWADILLVDDLRRIVPREVYVKGRLVARNGDLVAALPPPEYPDWFKRTVTIRRGKAPADFHLAANGQQARVWVIEATGEQIVNTRGQAELPVGAGGVSADPTQDVLKLAVVERYGKNGNIGIGFVRGFGLKNGAMASSVSHDHHNIVIAGSNDTDMAACVEAIETMQGGLAIASGGKVLGSLPLPVGGLMSERPAAEVIRQLETLNDMYHNLGGVFAAPFMSLSFISLPTVPELGITDRGLIDVREQRVISPFVA